MLPKTVIFDLDGTLADCEHRKHHIADPENRKWDEFHNDLDKDPVNKWCAELMEVLSKAGIVISIITGRPNSHVSHTKEWLSRNGVRYDTLFMREHGDWRDDPIIKKEIYDEHFKDKADVLFVVDDRNRVVQMWRELGLVCLQPYIGDF